MPSILKTTLNSWLDKRLRDSRHEGKTGKCLNFFYSSISGATAEWIYRPRSRLFVNTGETARINWKFVSGAIVVVYEKKPNSLGQGNRIALKAAGSPPEVMKSYRDKILVEESGALKIANAQLSDEGFYSIRITYKTNTLTDEVEVKLQGRLRT